MPMSNHLKKYLFPDQETRVNAVRLSSAWQTGLAHQNLPPAVRQLLGELVAASVLLASNLKLNGSLILQMQGDGPIALMIVECTSNLTIRATASLRESVELPSEGNLQSLINSQEQGRFSVILETREEGKQANTYQGIVPLEGNTVADALQAYMLHSEQLETRLWLGADDQHSAGLLIQRLPDDQTDTNDDQTEGSFERAVALASTLEQQELLQLDTDTLIRRLFWQESLTAFHPNSVAWSCPCTRQRVRNMLLMLGEEEVNSILAEQGKVDVACNFCGKPYHFDAIDCAELFRSGPDAKAPGSDSVH